MMDTVYQYYRIADERQDYKGKRYFKVDVNADKVKQVCVHPGEEQRGRGNTFGVCLIAKASFFSNYLGMNYVVQCKASEYRKAFWMVVKYLE